MVLGFLIFFNLRITDLTSQIVDSVIKKGERVKQDNKLKAQVEVIEKRKEMVYELKDKMKAQERKLKAQERKLKGHEYRVGKR